MQAIRLSSVSDDQNLGCSIVKPDFRYPVSREVATDRQEHFVHRLRDLSCTASEQRTMALKFNEATSHDSMTHQCSANDLNSSADFQCFAETLQQATQPGEFEETNSSVEMQVGCTELLPGITFRTLRQSAAAYIPRLRLRTDTSSMALQAVTNETINASGALRTNKRQREQGLDLSSQNNKIESSDGGFQRRKSVEIDCDCDTDHSWWMTIKIEDLKEVLLAINRIKSLVYQSDDHIMDGSVIELLQISQSSQLILESVIDDMRSEGGREI